MSVQSLELVGIYLFPTVTYRADVFFVVDTALSYVFVHVLQPSTEKPHFSHVQSERDGIQPVLKDKCTSR
jgi:hypothetical protein